MSASRAEAAWDDEWSRVVFDLCRKKEQSMNKSHSVFCFLFNYGVFSLRMWHQLKGKLCERQLYRWRTRWPPALTSFLPAAPGKSVCPVTLSAGSVCVCACASVFSVTLHQSHEVRWDCVWFLIPGKSGQLQRLTQIPWCETHTRLNTQTALVIYFFFFWV